MTEDCISQFSEKWEGRVLKKFSQKFNLTESRILGALSKLDEFLLNPPFRTCSLADPGTSRNKSSENREPTVNRALSDPYPEVEFSACRTSNITDQLETHHMMTVVGEEIPHCSSGTLSAKDGTLTAKTGAPHKSVTILQ